MGIILTLIGIGFFLLFLTFYFFRQNQASLSDRKHFEEKISALTWEKMGLEEAVVVYEHQIADMALQHKKLIEMQNLKIQSLEKYQSMVEETEEFLFEMDHTGRFTYANPTMLHRLGYHLEEISNIHYQELASPHQLPEIHQFYARQYHQKQTDSYGEWEAINRFGESVWIGLRIHMAFDNEGLIQSVKGIARDLSIQKAYESRDKEDFGFFQQLFQHMDLPILCFRLENETSIKEAKLFWVNEPSLKIIDLNWFEIKGLSLNAVSDDLAEEVEICLQNANTGRTWKTFKKPGSLFQVLAAANAQWLWVLLNDISSIENRYADAVQQAQFFREILDNLPIDIAVFNGDHQYQYVNPKAVKSEEIRHWMIGKSDEEYVKMRNRNLKKALFRFSKFQEVTRKKEPIQFDDYLLDSQNNLKIFMRHLVPVGNGNKPEMVIATGTDVSDKYQGVEIFLEQSDRQRFDFLLQKGNQAGTTTLTHQESLESKNDTEGNEVFGGLQKIERFFLYPGALWLLQKKLVQISHKNKGVEFFFSFQQYENQLFFIPRCLIALILEKLVIAFHSGFRLGIKLESEIGDESQLVIQIGFKKPLTEAEKEILEIVSSIWESEQYKVETDTESWSFNCPAILAEDLFAGRVLGLIPILKEKRIGLGPQNHKDFAWLSEELKSQGAEIIPFSLPNEFPLPNQMVPHLLVWMVQEDVSLLEPIRIYGAEQKVKILCLNQPENSLMAGADTNILVSLGTEATQNQILEAIWIHSRPHKTEDGAPNQAEKIELRFDKLLEITQGDKNFMATLIETYFSSMQECKLNFRENIESGNPEAMRFLLHKVRATINTFEIKQLEKFLVETIQEMAASRSFSEKKKKQLLEKVNFLCTNVEGQIRSFAKRENILLKS